MAKKIVRLVNERKAINMKECCESRRTYSCGGCDFYNDCDNRFMNNYPCDLTIDEIVNILNKDPDND